MSDNASTTALEVLRFRPEFAATFGFETALREGVERIYPLAHSAFPAVHAVEYLDDRHGLALVSTYVEGKRLSDMFRGMQPRTGLHPAFAAWLIRQLTTALSELQACGPDVAHGALSADRILLTADRRVMVVEHVLGTALATLGLSRARLWSDVGIVTVDEGRVRLDRRSDVVQIGLIALSVLLGRRVTLSDYPDHLSELLDEFSATAGRRSPTLVVPLRQWLEWALRIDGRGFKSARDARGGLADLPEGAALSLLGESSAEAALFPKVDSNETIRIGGDGSATGAAEREIESHARRSREHRAPLAANRPVESDRLFHRIAPSLALVLAILVVAEGGVIGALLYRGAVPISLPLLVDSRDEGDVVMVNGRLAGVTPLELRAGSETRSIQVVHRSIVAEARPKIAARRPANVAARNGGMANVAVDAAAADRTASHERSGKLTLVSPIALQVFEGKRLLGSSLEGPVVMAAGVHELELVNTALSYRWRQRIEIKPEEVVSLTVTPPTGLVNISAVPWARVWIDGTLVGETPIANLTLAAGDHEVIFRHPQLGDVHQTAVVRSGVMTRVSATLSR